MPEGSKKVTEVGSLCVSTLVGQSSRLFINRDVITDQLPSSRVLRARFGALSLDWIQSVKRETAAAPCSPWAGGERSKGTPPGQPVLNPLLGLMDQGNLWPARTMSE